MRETVEPASGIGGEISWNLAAEFDSVDGLADADRARLEAVPNVGPERAPALQEYLRE
ncbi:hypothetical protein BRC89_07765 [Halobacteriales archaeon QS_4_70_19]|nr:MAG: hypothetical protein BRC89_07765 [Halobacteriales archaeon QS_4_70_19]